MDLKIQPPGVFSKTGRVFYKTSKRRKSRTGDTRGQGRCITTFQWNRQRGRDGGQLILARHIAVASRADDSDSMQSPFEMIITNQVNGDGKVTQYNLETKSAEMPQPVPRSPVQRTLFYVLLRRCHVFFECKG